MVSIKRQMEGGHHTVKPNDYWRIQRQPRYKMFGKEYFPSYNIATPELRMREQPE